jgi:hypothetical protein
MRTTTLKAILKATVFTVALFLLTASASFAQTVSLTAAPTTTTLPDGQIVQMWGYTCTSATGTGVSCAAANTSHAVGTWAPVVITVPPGNLTISLTNSLPAPVPTSLTIVGQLGGGLGSAPSKVDSPAHPPQAVSWPTVGATADYQPPSQVQRVQSFATEIANGTTNSTLIWNNLKPGTYLIESGTHPSIQGPMGLYGVLVVTTAPAGTTAGTAYPGVSYNAEVPMILSEIDPVQNNAVAKAVSLAGFKETTVWSGQPGGCGNPTTMPVTGNCYPPAVNYSPRYYLVNGVSFDKTAGAGVAKSLFSATPGTATGTVLVRLVNAGLRMHVPSIVGATTVNKSSSTPTAAVPGLSLIAEDGNVLPGNPKVQNEVFMAAGKTVDVMINAPASGPALPVFDRQLSLSTNNNRDGGMQAYIGVNGAAIGATTVAAKAVGDNYFLVGGKPLTVSDTNKGVIANDTGVFGVVLLTPPAGGTVTLNANGTFNYAPNTGTTSDSFTYCANTPTGTACPANLTATVTLAACTTASKCLGGAPLTNPSAWVSNVASRFSVGEPGVLASDVDPDGHPLTAAVVGTPNADGTYTVDNGFVRFNADGSFTAWPSSVPTGTATVDVHFVHVAVNSQGVSSASNVDSAGDVDVIFTAGSGLVVNVLDAPSTRPGNTPVKLNDYRWIIEEDRTMFIDPNLVTNGITTVPTLGTNFHTSYMPVVAAGCVADPIGGTSIACEFGQTVFDGGVPCTSVGVPAGCSPTAGQHVPAVCDLGDGICRADAANKGMAPINPADVVLDPTKRYYISILPGDSGNDFIAGAGAPVPINPADPNSANRPFSIAKDCPSGPGGADFAPGSGTCGHGMGGANIAKGQTSVNVLLQETPFPTSQLAVFVFEDDSPLNGENDVHGGAVTATGIVNNKEPGLGGFEIVLWDDAGGTGDATGQMSYDMLNMPLSNALAGTIDQLTGKDACPISAKSDRLVGMIVTCPKFESDGTTVSPLVGQVVVANLFPGRYGVVAHPGADAIARGEEWLQTNTLDGQKAHDSFMKVGGPAYFQEFGPAGYHVSIGFANPKIINDRLAPYCASLVAPAACNNELKGTVTDMRVSRTPDQRLYSSGNHNALAFTQCYISVGDPDDDDIAFAKCDADGKFDFKGLPDGNWRITIFDQWNDQIVDGLSTPVALAGGKTVTMEIPVQQWHTNIYTSTFFDTNGNGVRDTDEPGLSLVPTNIRYRDGSYSNFNNTDLSGNAGFNEIFPLFNFYIMETDTARYKQTGVHVVYDAGGPADGTDVSAGSSNIADHLANSAEANHLQPSLHFPGSIYCADADCSAASILTGTGNTNSPSTGRIDPPWVTTEAWQGFIGQSEFIEFGKAPFAPGENGGIHGEVIYASTRPFDDPALLIHTSWTPNVPGVTVNLYQEGTAPDGTKSLQLVDTTVTSSFDDWAQGFRTNADGTFALSADGHPIPNMNCPGQDPTSLFMFTLKNTREYLNPTTTLPYSSQYKCYDGFAQFNQVQPAPFDGAYKFPSVVNRDHVTGHPIDGAATTGFGSLPGTNCSICVVDPTDPNTAMLPAGKYVVEMITPPGYELVKEEDKNILIGDNYIAPVAQQFTGLGAIYIVPDQAEVAGQYNANNAQNPTNNLGSQPMSEADTGSVEQKWPCVGQARIVPDYISLFPWGNQVSPFAGATRNLCDRKEIILEDQASVVAKFWVFSSTHVAAHFTGIMLDDLSSEFDPFSPQYGEKFAIPNAPISFKDFSGVEISRTYSDQWGLFNGLNYSTWEVNPPNPTGYGPTMMIACMNDPGPILDTRVGSPTLGQMIVDPLFNPNYSQFCYDIPFMPGQTQYMDTPVVPTAAFAEGYNLPDCSYPDATPAIKEVDGDGIGPWVGALHGTVASIALTNNGGTNYTVVPNITLTGGAGTGATASVQGMKVNHIVLSNGGNNYNTAPNVTINGGGGAGATAIAVINTTTHKVTGITVTNAGSGYTSRPSVNIAAPCFGLGCNANRAAAANATTTGVFMSVDTLAITAGGTGYTSAPNPVFSVLGATASTALGSSNQILTITALGDQTVPNNAYSGPSATTAPFNQKFVTRHYGFGTTQGTVSIGFSSTGQPIPATVQPGGWSDSQIKVAVPANLPLCQPAGQAAGGFGGAAQQIYHGTEALDRCGELVITRGDNKKSSIDTVTVTAGGNPPAHVTGENATHNAIQNAIDAAKPGDLVIVNPDSYDEMVLMWKPVRLQGVGAASVTVNANTFPSGPVKIDSWRRKVDCLFDLSLNGGTINPSNPFDPTGDNSCSFISGGYGIPQVDPIPLEPIAGWDPALNGNIAELLQEPTIMGAYEGAAITVLGKGNQGSIINGVLQYDPNCTGNANAAATSCIPLTNSKRDCITYPSNFFCNPSRVDGMSFVNSSQGGGGIFLHGWNHFTEVSNNRVHSNGGTLAGGILVGQPETPEATIAADGVTEVPFAFNVHVNIHNNSITQNVAYGDELNSTTTEGAGGTTICTGADSYLYNHNWVCGNLSIGDGGGFTEFGFMSPGGNISNNSFLFNQTNNITIPTHGGGLAIMGAPTDGPVCEASVIDVDCPPTLTDGIGPGLVIDSNLILGNTAESGSGGGIRFQSINGNDVVRDPGFPNASGGFFGGHPGWFSVNVTNNIIVNNVAGWDGGGISIVDGLKINLINNTIVSNDTTASSGVLFNTLGAPNANTPPPTNGGGTCDPTIDPNCTANQIVTSTPQAAGLVTMRNTPNMVTNLVGLTVNCPAGFGYTGGNCRNVSLPNLENNLIWHNRAFNIHVGGLGTGPLAQQNIVNLVPALNQASTGQCVTGANYWDIGVRGDTAPNNHSSTFRLSPRFSILTDAVDYPGANNSGLNPAIVSIYCNGSKVPPENGGMGYIVPPGIADATTPNPVFNLTPAATVDEGNNWINLTYGPLSLYGPNAQADHTGLTPALGNYSITPGTSSAQDTGTATGAPNHDFFGTSRPQGTGYDIGAVEVVSTAPRITTIVPASGAQGTTVAVTLTGSNFNGVTVVSVSGTGVTVPSFTIVSPTSITASFVIAANAAITARNVTVTNATGPSGAVTFTVLPMPITITSITPAWGLRGTNSTTPNVVSVTLVGTNLTGGTVHISSGGFGGGTGGVTIGTPTINAGGTSLTVTFSISSTATLANRNVTVTNAVTTSNAVTFTVGAVLTSISPTTGTRGTSFTATLTGAGLTGATGVNINGGSGVTVSNVVPVNSTTVTATFTIAPAPGNTSTGNRGVSVAVPNNGNTNNVTFTVN